jgi:hypothetical protein
MVVARAGDRSIETVTQSSAKPGQVLHRLLAGTYGDYPPKQHRRVSKSSGKASYIEQLPTPCGNALGAWLEKLYLFPKTKKITLVSSSISSIITTKYYLDSTTNL